MWKIALNKQTQVEVKGAVAEVLNQAITWPPNLPKFIELCQSPQIDTDEAFNRMLNGKPSNGIAEYETRQECSYRCRRLAEDKARALFKNVLTRNIQRVKNGDLVEPEIKGDGIDPPEEFKKRETTEQRNTRLDAEIEKILEAGTPLRGPFKKRHNETKGK